MLLQKDQITKLFPYFPNAFGILNIPEPSTTARLLFAFKFLGRMILMIIQWCGSPRTWCGDYSMVWITKNMVWWLFNGVEHQEHGVVIIQWCGTPRTWCGDYSMVWITKNMVWWLFHHVYHQEHGVMIIQWCGSPRLWCGDYSMVWIIENVVWWLFNGVDHQEHVVVIFQWCGSPRMWCGDYLITGLMYSYYKLLLTPFLSSTVSSFSSFFPWDRIMGPGSLDW